jgi:hypothetical protein
MSLEKFGGQNTNQKALEQELEDHGINDVSEWKQAIGTEEKVPEVEEDGVNMAEGMIETKKWQDRLDDMFAQGDYPSIRTLQVVKPNVAPSPELVKNKLNELVVSRPNGWEASYKAIREILGTPLPDITVINGEFEKLFDALGKEKESVGNLKNFAKATGCPPPLNLVQGKYKSILSQSYYSQDDKKILKSITDLAGQKPDSALIDEFIKKGEISRVEEVASMIDISVTSDIIQRTYEKSLEKYGNLDVYSFSKASEKPKPELVQLAYQKIVEKHDQRWLGAIESLKNATGVNPIFLPEQIVPIFEEYLKNASYRQEYEGTKRIIEVTGIQPPLELIQAAALHIIDGGHSYIDQGKSIKKGLERLKSIGVDFEISESLIQERYKKAIAEKQANTINNLYGALGVRPSVDKETARRFIASFMDDTYYNYIPELEKTFDVKFEPTEEEINQKYEEDLKSFNFEKVKKIEQATGIKPDRVKLENAVIRLLDSKVNIPPHGYASGWDKDVKKVVDDFEVILPQEKIVDMYRRIIDDQTIYTDNLEKLNKISNVTIPDGLAQAAYQRVILPEYIDVIQTDRSTTARYSRGEAFEKIFKLSGNLRPNIPENQLQIFYRGCLEKGFDGSSDIEKISKVSGVSPVFDSHDINQLYKKWILSGSADNIRKVKGVVNIRLELDNETVTHINNEISTILKKALSVDVYSRDVYKGKEFQDGLFENDLRKISEFISNTGIKPEDHEVRKIYSEILSQDSYWYVRIKEIAQTTGIKPEFNSEQVQSKGTELVEKGDLSSLEDLQKFGTFNFDSASVEKGYTLLLSRKDGDRNYDYDLLKNFKKLYKLSAVPPNDDQLVKLTSHMLDDYDFARSGQKIDKIFEVLEKELGIPPSQEIIQSIAEYSISHHSSDLLKQLKRKVGILPPISAETISEKLNQLLEKQDFDYLTEIKGLLGVEKLPADEVQVQNIYSQIVGQEDFGKQDSKSSKAFYKIYELTGIMVSLSEDKLTRAYECTRFMDWPKVMAVTKTKPPEASVQYKYFQFLTEYSRYNRSGYNTIIENIEPISQLTGQSINKDTIKKALDYFAVKFGIRNMRNIIEATGIKPEISNDVAQKAYMMAIEKDHLPSWSGDKLVDTIEFFNDTCGIRPDDEVLGLMYAKTLQKIDYEHGSKGLDGEQVYPQFWVYLVSKFGKPKSEVIQKVYSTLLLTVKQHQGLLFPSLQVEPVASQENFKYVEEFTGINPYIDVMAELSDSTNGAKAKKQIENKLQILFQNEFFAGNIEAIQSLEKQFGRQFQIDEIESQVLYTKLFFEKVGSRAKEFKFLFKRSGIGPSREIVIAFLSQDKEILSEENIGLLKVLVSNESYIDLFDDMDAKKVSGMNDGNLIRYVRYLGSDVADIFPDTHTKVVEKITAKIEEDLDIADYFLENLQHYYKEPWVSENLEKAVKQYSVAQKFVYAAEYAETIWKNEPWVANILAKAKPLVAEHESQWGDNGDQDDEYNYSHGNEGFSESDPYEKHPWRFGGEQVRMSSLLSKVISGYLEQIHQLDDECEKLNLNKDQVYEIHIAFGEIREKVDKFYKSFLDRINSSPNIKDEDKQALLNSETNSVKMTPLLDNVTSFVARYLVQSMGGDMSNINEVISLEKDMDRVLKEGFDRYVKIYDVDVPLYDKLYEEFDGLRETGRNPLEVYLGRDGIYAYIGRKAEDVARRRKLGLKGRKKLKEMGEVVEINPRYVVYPRYFRDNINYETKRQFLEQEGISPEADPLFYDTGYTGTIPEQIMRTMDFSDEDIEKRIRLLSAPSVHRRVKGISENARSEIIEYIEHNAKTENTAEGLIIDEKTGKIRHIAKPTTPEEQFYFMMVKQAVARHYWLQEQLHHEPSGNINLDSEHYTIRIRQEYAKFLPKDFIHDPKEFFAQHGELLKGSKGEGEYPDEEIVLFKLIDGTEIVAKKIELRKAKEARKEFSILIAAKKEGLPTAEPVGFLSGKEDGDGSYLLMKKLEGLSGRNIEKVLKESGKYSEDQCKTIMRQIADKNKEMAELFREKLKIDKRWRIKDTIIEFNEETGEVGSVIPIDWERAQNYNPDAPKEIDQV